MYDVKFGGVFHKHLMKLQLLDVFAKTAEDARVRTSGGGAVTLLAACVLSWLLLLQFRSYLTYTWDHALTIDSARGEKMTITLDMVFPNLPCELLSVDAIDENGDIQENLDDVLRKQDLDLRGNPLNPEVKQRQEVQRENAIKARGPEYPGPCWGADAGFRAMRGLPNDAVAKCLTCEDVHQAYAQLNWAFDDGHGFEQCVDEGYPEHLRENKENGCRISGNVVVSKVVGRIHIAPGEAHFARGRHSHDLSTYSIPDLPYGFSHTINQLSFGGREAKDLSPTEDPLQGFVGKAPHRDFQFRYFLKVVGTDYIYRDGTVLQTNQYSVTHHERPLQGGRDADHPHSAHQIGGIPGVWINYDISPMKVRETQKREQSFGTLMMNTFAIVGAVITTAAVIDSGVYAVDQALKARKER